MGNQPEDLVDLLRSLIDRALQLCNNQQRLGDKWDELALACQKLLDLLEQLDGAPRRRLANVPRSTATNGFSRRPPELKPGEFRLDWIPGDRARVRLGEIESELSPQLAKLLDLLAAGEPGEDGLVPWKSTAELAAGLAPQQKDRRKARSLVSSTVQRLREFIDERRGLRAWIQSVPGLGYRLAYRSQPA